MCKMEGFFSIGPWIGPWITCGTLGHFSLTQQWREHDSGDRREGKLPVATLGDLTL